MECNYYDPIEVGDTVVWVTDIHSTNKIKDRDRSVRLVPVGGVVIDIRATGNSVKAKMRGDERFRKYFVGRESRYVQLSYLILIKKGTRHEQ